MTRTARRLRLALAALALPACGDIATPSRTDTYEWRLIAPSEPGPGLDTLSYHWGQSDLPLRIWVEDAEELPGHMARAIEVWRDAFLYGEFDAVIVSDSVGADVLVRAGAAPPKPGDARLHAFAPECSGATDLDIDVANAVLRLPIRVFLDPVVTPEDPGLEPCLALTSIHELGHALGIFAHSPEPSDIMFANPEVDGLSERDRNTAEAAYHTVPTLGVSREE